MLIRATNEIINIMTTKKVVFVLGFDGSAFSGSVLQAKGDVRTVEGEFSAALARITGGKSSSLPSFVPHSLYLLVLQE